MYTFMYTRTRSRILLNMVAEHRASAALHFVPLDGGFPDEAAQAASDRFQKLEADVLQIREAIKRFAERTEGAGLVSDSAGVAKLIPQERNQQRTVAGISEVPIPQRQEHVPCPRSRNICSGEQCRPGFGDSSNLTFPCSSASASFDRWQTTVRFTDSSAREETDPVLAVGDPHLTSVSRLSAAKHLHMHLTTHSNARQHGSGAPRFRRVAFCAS